MKAKTSKISRVTYLCFRTRKWKYYRECILNETLMKPTSTFFKY